MKLRGLLLVLALSSGACARAQSPDDFATALAAVLDAPSREEESKAGKALQAAWEGKTYQWTGRAQRVLCSVAERSCAVDVFAGTGDAARPRHIGGMYPAVRFSEDGWAALHNACKGLSACDVTFKATLTSVRLDPDSSLAIRFDDAGVVNAREVRRTAVAAPEPKPPKDFDPSRLARPGDAATFDTSRLQAPVFGL